MEFVNFGNSGEYNNDYLLLLERSSSGLASIDEDVFEGTAAVLDVLNDNNRIYTKEEYFKHLPYLQEKIKRGRLFGEIDHPQGYYDVRLKNMSHKVEALWYDEQSNTIRIKIRLLKGTPGGDFARKLVELGIPLAISSRAVGKVVDNVPEILRIFTFDLVAEPGFREAILQPANSDLKFDSIVTENIEYISESLNDFQEKSCLNQCELLNENENFGDYLQIYKINNVEVISELDNIFETNTPTENNLNNMDTKEFAAYSEKTKTEIGELKGLLSKVNEDLQEVRGQIETAQQQAQQVQTQPPQYQVQDAQAQMTELPNITDEDTEVEAIDKIRTYVDFMSSELTKIGQAQEALQESFSGHTKVLQNIGKAVNRTINHENLLTKKINETLNFLDMEVVPSVNESANVTNTQSYLITKLIEMADHLSDKTNDALNYGNFLGSVSEAHAGFMNMLAENLDEKSTIEGNKVNEGDVPEIDDNVNEGDDAEAGGEENAANAETAEPVNESLGANIKKQKKVTATNTKTTDNSAKSLFEKLNTSASKILERIDESSTMSVLESQYPFLTFLNTENKNKFFGLDTNTKKEVVDTLNKGVYFNQKDVMSIMEAVVFAKDKDLPNHMKFIPNEFKPIYEGLSEYQRSEIDNMAKSGFYRLDTAYQVKSFWHSLDLHESLNMATQDKLKEDKEKQDAKIVSLNESKNENVDRTGNFAYGQDFVNNILNR